MSTFIYLCLSTLRLRLFRGRRYAWKGWRYFCCSPGLEACSNCCSSWSWGQRTKDICALGLPASISTFIFKEGVKSELVSPTDDCNAIMTYCSKIFPFFSFQTDSWKKSSKTNCHIFPHNYILELRKFVAKLCSKCFHQLVLDTFWLKNLLSPLLFGIVKLKLVSVS